MMQWFPQYLAEDFGTSDSLAALIAAVIPLPGIAGPYIAVFIDRKFIHNECLTAAALYGVSFVSLLTLALIGHLSIISAVACIAISVAAMWGVNTILLTYLSYHYGRMGISSAVSGTINSFVYIGSTLGSSLYGRTAAFAGWGVTLYIWCAVAGVAVIASVIAGAVWKKKKPE